MSEVRDVVAELGATRTTPDGNEPNCTPRDGLETITMYCPGSGKMTVTW